MAIRRTNNSAALSTWMLRTFLGVLAGAFWVAFESPLSANRVLAQTVDTNTKGDLPCDGLPSGSFEHCECLRNEFGGEPCDIGEGEGEGEGEDYMWATLDGTFSTPSNWQPEGIPTAADTAIFTSPKGYTVSLGTAQSSRLVVRNGGNVTFSGSLYQIVGGDGANPSVVVGDVVGFTQLVLDPLELQSLYGTVALASGTNGRVLVTGVGAQWNLTNDLLVGDGGMGTFEVSLGGRVTAALLSMGITSGAEGMFGLSQGSSCEVGSTRIGVSGNGILDVNNSRFMVTNGDLIMAAGVNSTGSVTVNGRGSLMPEIANLEAVGIVVGEMGAGTFDVGGGALVRALSLFINDGSPMSSATVSGAPGGNATQLTIGGAMDIAGVLSIQDSAQAMCDSAVVASPNIDPNTGRYDAIVDVGFAGWSITGGLRIGDEPVSDPVLVFGDLFVHDGGRVVAGNLFLQEESRIRGDGDIFVFDVALLDGIVAPGTMVQQPKQSGETGGTLTIEGDVEMGGILEIDVMGLADGEFDVLSIDGQADLSGATIRMRFQEGFLPQTGDQVPFLVATGAVTMDAVTLEFEGVAEGFDFEVNEVGGLLMFEALNDAQALAQPGVGCSAGGGAGGASVMFPLLFAAVVLMAFRRERAHFDG